MDLETLKQLVVFVPGMVIMYFTAKLFLDSAEKERMRSGELAKGIVETTAKNNEVLSRFVGFLDKLEDRGLIGGRGT